MILTISPDHWWSVVLIVAPQGDISESLVEPPVLEVFDAHDTSAARCVNQVIERDCTLLAILGLPVSRNRPAWVGDFVFSGPIILAVRLKRDRLDGDILKSLCTASSGIAEQHFVGFGSNNVPGIAARAIGLDKVCIWFMVSLGHD